MQKQCPICKKMVDDEMSQLCQEAEHWVLESIRHNHPAWIEKDGTCSKCLDYYRRLGEQK